MTFVKRGRHKAVTSILAAIVTAPMATVASAGGDVTSRNANIAVVQSFWTDVWTKKQFDRIDSLFAEDFVIHSAGKQIGPRKKFKAWVKSFFANIDDLTLDVHDIFADGDKVITRWTCRGKFTGTMFGIKGEGQQISFTGMNLMTVSNGVITEAWVERDALGLARQIGLISE